MARKHPARFKIRAFLSQEGKGRTILRLRKKQMIFAQGDAGDAVFYVLEGRVKLTVVSRQGKEAIVAILKPGEFFGEACLDGQPRTATAVAWEHCCVLQIKRPSMVEALRREPAFAEMFMAHLLSRNVRIEADLIDHLFNTSERRLARALLLLAHVGKEGGREKAIP
ncbi:MAG: Crp/Fnr family transcriptional regulator, partial [Gaiellales bacterium]